MTTSSCSDWHMSSPTLSTPHNLPTTIHSLPGQRLYPATDQHGQLQHASTKAATDPSPGIQFSSLLVWGWRYHRHWPSSLSPSPEQIQSVVCPMDCEIQTFVRKPNRPCVRGPVYKDGRVGHVISSTLRWPFFSHTSRLVSAWEFFSTLVSSPVRVPF